MPRPSSSWITPFVLCFLIFCFSVAVFAQSTDPTTLERRAAGGGRGYYIQGRVFDAASNEPVNQATVTLTRVGGVPLQHTITDSMGNFFFSSLSPGNYEVEARAQGYDTARESVQLTIGPNSSLHINLQPRTTEARPVVIEPLSLDEQEAPEEAREQYKRAVDAYRQRKLEESRAHFEEALRLHPRFASAQSGLGVVLLQLGDAAGAQAAFEAAIEINATYAPPRVYLGALYNALHRYADAIIHLRSAVTLRPSSWMAHFEISRSYWALGDVERAEEHIVKAHDLQKKVPQVHMMRANVYVARNNPAAAMKEMDEVLTLSPQGPMADLVRQRRTELSAQLKSAKP